MVDADPESVEARLWAGEITCLDCGSGLRPWGHARPRTLRDHGEPVEIQPRRSICRKCSERLGRFATHVLLPTLTLLRRADVVSVIGEALMATYQEERSRREVAARAGVPLDTMRGWRRRFRERAEEIRVQFTELAHEWDPEQGGIRARASPELDALEAIGVAAAAAVRRFGPEPLWELVAGASGGRLLSNTSSPLPAPA
jgi:hypothetical protein